MAESARIYIGNLPFDATADELREHLEKFGIAEAKDVHVVTDRETGQGRGFGFAEFRTEPEAQAAIGLLDQSDYGGRCLRVSPARPRENRGGAAGGPGRPAGGGGHQGGGGGGRRREDR